MRVSSSKKSSIVCATAAVAHACPDGYSGKFGVTASGSHVGSASVDGFPSVSPPRIAVIGRQKLKWNYAAQQAINASANAANAAA
jgi:hypothetical protein